METAASRVVLIMMVVGSLSLPGNGSGSPGDEVAKHEKAEKEVRTMQEKKTVYLTTIQEYSEYDPSRAKEDAAVDIREGDIHVFFLSVEEVPFPLVIEDGLEALPPYTFVGIGGGCTDEIGSPDVAPEYRDAFQRAVRYGELYNQAIAAHFGLKTKAGINTDLPSEAVNPTRAFLGEEAGWGGIRMELRDVMGPFGGREVTVSGSGEATVRIFRPGEKRSALEEKKYRVFLEQADVRRLVEAFITNEYLTIILPDEQMPPDTGRPAITLVNGQGLSHTLEGWARTSIVPDADPKDPVVRYDRIYKELLRIERMVDSSQQ